MTNSTLTVAGFRVEMLERAGLVDRDVRGCTHWRTSEALTLDHPSAMTSACKAQYVRVSRIMIRMSGRTYDGVAIMQPDGL